MVLHHHTVFRAAAPTVNAGVLYTQKKQHYDEEHTPRWRCQQPNTVSTQRREEEILLGMCPRVFVFPPRLIDLSVGISPCTDRWPPSLAVCTKSRAFNTLLAERARGLRGERPKGGGRVPRPKYKRGRPLPQTLHRSKVAVDIARHDSCGITFPNSIVPQEGGRKAGQHVNGKRSTTSSPIPVFNGFNPSSCEELGKWSKRGGIHLPPWLEKCCFVRISLPRHVYVVTTTVRSSPRVQVNQKVVIGIDNHGPGQEHQEVELLRLERYT